MNRNQDTNLGEGHIVFVSAKEKYVLGIPWSVAYGIYRIDAEQPGQARVVVEPGEAVLGRPTWSPDGKRIAYYRYHSKREVYLVSADASGTPELLGDRPGKSPAWSPDGEAIACVKETRINLVDPETGQEAEIKIPGVDVFIGSHLSWSPDGRQIAFRRTLKFDSDRQPGDVGGIAVVNVDGSDFVPLTFDDEDRYPAWSPDGLRIAFVRGGDIYLMASDGTGVTRLTDGGKRRDPAWSPDGTKLAFVSTRNSECTTFMDSTFCTSELYVMDADGSNERLVRSEKNEAIYDPDWVGRIDERVVP